MSSAASPTRYETMDYRRCGRSGLLLPRVSLGLWHNFGGVDDFENTRTMILGAFDAGITHFDLANNYGPPPGSAEERLGWILSKELIAYRDELIISTKAGYRMWPGPYGEWGSRKYLLASLDQSLRRMGIDYVDIFYSHRPDADTPLEETVRALSHAVKSGKALYVGVSNYPPDLTRRASELLRSEGISLLIHQPRYNLFDRRIEEGLPRVLSDEGIGCIPFCPLAQGLLTNRYLNGVTPDSRAAKPHGFLKPDHITEETLRRVRALDRIAKARGQSLAQMSLAWILSKPFVTSVLIGASRLEQIHDNIEAVRKTSFAQEESIAIDEACRL